ncbi:site-specific integrase [Butyrivibrio sp. INlla16]|uniref:site-specific integrase n=1 Tax=Butyrivibrio sp. INlla16 TaxID=1520807 RepID=UPI00088C494D|nr:site-specific integrase [Butyrivibrio sp. INlla16]SDB12819.1 hypothetical protein SAMN02910263_00579 [Butyrivibrio sp. INlla16]SDB49666.1 hypothetical protein SAMN02910263_02458 [Butyrivibrio sp. INlla16]
METVRENQLEERRLKYAVFTVRNCIENGESFDRSFIVLKNEYGIIERFTRLQDYAGIYTYRTYKPLQSNPEPKLYYICKMLNYILVENGGRFGIRHVFDITKDMMQEFFDYYAMSANSDGTYHSEGTVERCISCCTFFMDAISRRYGGFVKVTKEELYYETTIRLHTGKLKVRKIPKFQATGLFDESDGPFRDMPAKVMEQLLPMAFKYAPDIAFGIALQAFAGLRAGEVCNVRQESSKYGAGLLFEEAGGAVRRIRIDLKHEYRLRNDGAEVGKIKKERFQQVYPDFIKAFMRAYELHKAYLKTVDYEADFAPMFVNSNGLAMSYETYRRKFKVLINDHLRTWLISSTDPDFRRYGQLLYENSLSTHSLRHWYTVQLVLRGCEVAEVQFWRGDKNPESAFTYLQNKGDLVRELEITSEKLISSLLEIGGEMYGLE